MCTPEIDIKTKARKQENYDYNFLIKELDIMQEQVNSVSRDNSKYQNKYYKLNSNRNEDCT